MKNRAYYKVFKMAKNQYIIQTLHKRIFQSYDSTICIITDPIKEHKGQVIIGCDWSYSNTTMRYFKKFLELEGFQAIAGAKNVRKAIEKGFCGSYDVVYDSCLF